LIVTARAITKEPFDIPEKLGGNNLESQIELMDTLNNESYIIASIPSGNEMFWSGPFRFPLEGSVKVTDTYGYTRLTGFATVSHKGTDFRAATGTPVVAINSGRVSYTDYLRNYGNTIVLDHGLGLQSIYMHLSQVDVKVGDEVERGQIIGLSGDTGYVLGPHLHLSIKLGGISIDPEKFLALFGN
jgi:murein DD-endopeptidase MepM/ murein hydrolase activator NlpD